MKKKIFAIFSLLFEVTILSTIYLYTQISYNNSGMSPETRLGFFFLATFILFMGIHYFSVIINTIKSTEDIGLIELKEKNKTGLYICLGFLVIAYILAILRLVLNYYIDLHELLHQWSR